jgi:hypothetical protein
LFEIFKHKHINLLQNTKPNAYNNLRNTLLSHNKYNQLHWISQGVGEEILSDCTLFFKFEDMKLVQNTHDYEWAPSALLRWFLLGHEYINTRCWGLEHGIIFSSNLLESMNKCTFVSHYAKIICPQTICEQTQFFSYTLFFVVAFSTKRRFPLGYARNDLLRSFKLKTHRGVSIVLAHF